MTVDRESGDSLVEVLVALAVLSIGIAGLLGALGAHSIATTVNRDQSQVESTLLSAAEYVKSLPFAQCTPIGWQEIDEVAVPRDDAYTVEYGSAAPLGSVPCTKLAVVKVRVSGNSFQGIAVDVVKRP